MAAEIIDGRALAARIREDLKIQVSKMAADGHAPLLVPLLVGATGVRRMYVRRLQEACDKIGIDCTPVMLPVDATQEELEAEITKINTDPGATGLFLTLPLPPGLDGARAQRLIAPEKDVEGVSPGSLGNVTLGEESMAPTAARAAFELARSTGVQVEGAEVVIVGHSEIVGKPLSLLFLKALATTTVCHVATRDLSRHTRRADILCVAVGKPALITAEMIKPGAVVIDVGISRVVRKGPDGRPVLNTRGKHVRMTVGDVAFEGACEVAGWITPVPGGVAPMTVAMLLSNTVKAAREQMGL